MEAHKGDAEGIVKEIIKCSRNPEIEDPMCRKMAAAYDRCVSNEMLSKNMNYDDYIHEQCKTIVAKLEQEFEGAKGVTLPELV